MPSKHTIKTYLADKHYHIFNRGIEKRNIFTDEQDYEVFINYLETALLPKENQKTGKQSHRVKNFTNSISLIAYCLMPNCFHLFVHQKDARVINEFMQSLIVRYTMYFNKRHKRYGPLFQGKYRAVLVEEDKHILHLTRYIHLKPKEITENPARAHSSLAEYLGYRTTPWIKSQSILDFFIDENKRENIPHLRFMTNYRTFTEGNIEESTVILGHLTLE